MKKCWSPTLVTGIVISAVLTVSGDALANQFEVSIPNSREQLQEYSVESDSTLGQSVPGASQFTDVSPGDWAFQALDDLVRRYDCLKGYPDGSYRGDRALSRYEFAAGLNACLQQMERILAEATSDLVTREELEILRRLLEEFEVELAALNTRVDNLESRTTFLEDNQFSTTTKLNGEVVGEFHGLFVDDKAYTIPFNDTSFNSFFNEVYLTVIPFPSPTGLTGNFAGQQLAEFLNRSNFGTGLFELIGIPSDAANPGGLLSNYLTNNIAPDPSNPPQLVGPDVTPFLDYSEGLANTLYRLQTADTTSRDAEDEAVFGYRARLNFDSSFSGRDRLRVRLQSSNMNSLGFSQLNTTQADRNLGDNDNNDIVLQDLSYRFMIGNNVRANIIANGADIDDILDSETTAPFSSDNLALANYYNPILYETGESDQAFGLNVLVSDVFSFDIAYMADEGEDASDGLFGSDYVIPVQLNFNISDRLKLALGYSLSYRGGGVIANRSLLVDGGAPAQITTIGNAGGDLASFLGQNPFLYFDQLTDLHASAATTHTYNFNASWDVADWMNISGYVGFAHSTAESGPRFGDNAHYGAWGLNLAFPDLAKEGDVLVAGFGQLPKVSVDNGPDDPDTSYVATLEYRFPITDNIELTPGGYAIINPNGNAANDTLFVGMLRAKLKF